MPTSRQNPTAAPRPRPAPRPHPNEPPPNTQSGGPFPENRLPVTQNIHPALALIDSLPDVFARQGTVVATWKAYAGRKLGPYYRLVYRREGRQRTVYIGRAGALVDRVRAALARLKRPLRRHRQLVRLQNHVRRALRLEKIRLNTILAKWGLHLKGFELRGPRGALERALTQPQRPTSAFDRFP